MSDLQTYRGSCHCGRATFEARAKLDHAVVCKAFYAALEAKRT